MGIDEKEKANNYIVSRKAFLLVPITVMLTLNNVLKLQSGSHNTFLIFANNSSENTFA